MSEADDERMIRVDLDLPSEVRWIVDTLEDAGYSAWTVGGGVRDALAGLTPGDWDVTTSARPGDVRRLFRRTVPIGIEHGTVGVIGRSGKMYEVTTFRRDVETFGRKARVAFADRLEDDLERRDFTINAVAWNPRTGELRDPHGGQADLAEGVLRTVGDPERRFEEDRLRVLRALRFAGRYDLRIDPGTWESIRSSSDKLGNLSAERVREELWKVLAGQRWPSRSLQLYADSGVLASLYPELDAVRTSGAGRWEQTLMGVDWVPRTRPIVRLATLLHDLGSSGAAESAALARALLLRLRSSNADMDRVAHLIAQQNSVPDPESIESVRRWMRRVGRDYHRDLLRLLIARCRAEDETITGDQIRALRGASAEVLRSGVPLEIRELAIGGNDLRQLGIPPGPQYGEILSDLLERVTDAPHLNQRDELLKLARSIGRKS